MIKYARKETSFFRKIIKNLINAAYPQVCLCCLNKISEISDNKLVCLKCWGKIKINPPPFCHRCGRHLGRDNITKNICPRCIRQPLSFDRAFSPFVYEGVIKELIHAFKYKGKDYLGDTLSKLMNNFIKEYNLPINFIDIIIPIPLHKSRMREREFNQAKVLSNHIADEFNKNLSESILVRHKNTQSQTDLESTDRFSNMRNSFSVTNKELVKGKNILLVDDVLTTGATSSEAAEVLKEAGAQIVFVLTLAH